MTFLSYNDQQNQQLEARHIFFPGAYALAGEVIIGIVALVAFNLSALGNQFLSSDIVSASRDSSQAWTPAVQKLLNAVLGQHTVQRLLLFLLWAAIGALLYIFIFRLAQMLFGARSSLGTGWQLMQREHAEGLMKWLASLHDLFLRLIVFLVGSAALLSGALICFGIASQELQHGLAGSFPANIWPLLVSLLAAVLSVRFVAMGITLLSSRFRNWYAG